MRRLLALRPSPAMVVACVALAVALGGTGYAAITLPRNSVGNKQLRANAVTGAKVRAGSLLAGDFRAGQLPRGPRGAQGPSGESATGSRSMALGYASRDPVIVGPPVDVGATPVDLIGLGTPAGTAGYVASSGPVKADGPSRLIAEAQGVILNAAAGRGDVGCKVVLVGSDVRAIGNYVNANLDPNSGYIPVAVSAGADVESGTYDVRLQCSSGAPLISFHRGNLTVTVAPR